MLFDTDSDEDHEPVAKEVTKDTWISKKSTTLDGRSFSSPFLSSGPPPCDQRSNRTTQRTTIRASQSPKKIASIPTTGSCSYDSSNYAPPNYPSDPNKQVINATALFQKRSSTAYEKKDYKPLTKTTYYTPAYSVYSSSRQNQDSDSDSDSDSSFLSTRSSKRKATQMLSQNSVEEKAKEPEKSIEMQEQERKEYGVNRISERLSSKLLRENEPSSMEEEKQYLGKREDRPYRSAFSDGSFSKLKKEAMANRSNAESIADKCTIDHDDWLMNGDDEPKEEEKTTKIQYRRGRKNQKKNTIKKEKPDRPYDDHHEDAQEEIESYCSRKLTGAMTSATGPLSSSESEEKTWPKVSWSRIPKENQKLSHFILHDPKKYRTNADSPSATTYYLNKYLNRFLFSYQREGVEWLFKAFKKKHGAILGDDMGMGKTIQTIGFLSVILRKTGTAQDRKVFKALRESRGKSTESKFDDETNPGPVLIIVPASLLGNWKCELAKWMSVDVQILRGSNRKEVIEQMRRGRFEVVVCSYDMLSNHVSELKDISFLAVIFDEVHKLKNVTTKINEASREIKCARKYGLTGTLMQNYLKELFYLMDTIVPECLGLYPEFKKGFIKPIKEARWKSAKQDDVDVGQQQEEKLRIMMKPYFMQRDKSINPYFDTIQKFDKVVFSPLTEYQQRTYRRVLESQEFKWLSKTKDEIKIIRDEIRGDEEAFHRMVLRYQQSALWNRLHGGEDCQPCKQCRKGVPYCLMLSCLNQLIKVSNHLDMVKVQLNSSEEMKDAERTFCTTAFGDDADKIGGLYQTRELKEMIRTDYCGKMIILEKLLAMWSKSRDKVLIFSRSTRMLDIIQNFVLSKGYVYDRLDGGTDVNLRQGIVDGFNNDSMKFIFLISTKAGGLGLNITSAENVVIFDPSWNPAHDSQAQDRAYRIGQLKDVNVFRLISLGTLEELMYVRQIYKQQLAEATLNGKEAPRYFEGVQGDATRQGELFGIRNMLQYNESGLLRDVQVSFDDQMKNEHDIVMCTNKLQYKQESASTERMDRKVDFDTTGFDDDILDLIDAIDDEDTIIPEPRSRPKPVIKKRRKSSGAGKKSKNESEKGTTDEEKVDFRATLEDLGAQTVSHVKTVENNIDWASSQPNNLDEEESPKKRWKPQRSRKLKFLKPSEAKSTQPAGAQVDDSWYFEPEENEDTSLYIPSYARKT